MRRNCPLPVTPVSSTGAFAFNFGQVTYWVAVINPFRKWNYLDGVAWTASVIFWSIGRKETLFKSYAIRQANQTVILRWIDDGDSLFGPRLRQPYGPVSQDLGDFVI